MTIKKTLKRARRALKQADIALKAAAAALDQHSGVAVSYGIAAADIAELRAEEVPDISACAFKLPASASASMTTKNGLADAARLLREKGPAAFKTGDEIEVIHELGKTRWTVIGIDCDELPGREHTLTIMNTTPLAGHCFDAPDLKNPFGRNRWHASSARAYLNGEFLDGFTELDRQAIGESTRRTYSFTEKEYIHTTEKLFLLSASEAGFEVGGDVQDEGKVYPYFKTGEEARQLSDKDGEARDWWLRSPHPWNGSNVRIVNPSGALSNDFASDGNALAAACVIG